MFLSKKIPVILFALFSTFGCVNPYERDLTAREKAYQEAISRHCGCRAEFSVDAAAIEFQTHDGTFWAQLNYNPKQQNPCLLYSKKERDYLAYQYARVLSKIRDKDHRFICIQFYSSVFPNDRMESPTCTITYKFLGETLELLEYSPDPYKN